MLSKLMSLLLLIVGIIHLLPVAGGMGGARLAAMYGISVDNPDLEILLRHRAVLFGLLGVFLIAAAFVKNWQWGALIAGTVSVCTFLWLAWDVGSFNNQLRRVVVADSVALACLALAALLRTYLPEN